VKQNRLDLPPEGTEVFEHGISQRIATVGIIGLGYVGLPLARAFAGANVPTIGFDVDGAKVARLNAGQTYIRQIPDAAIVQMREQRFEATTDFERLAEPDAILICVPTPLTEAREPDLTYVIKSVEAVAARVRPGQLVVLESTTYPTTTRSIVLPLLERSGLKVGKDFYLAFSPEREDPGNQTHALNTIPKVVGGLDPASSERACALYSLIVPKVVRVSSPEIAEACKILENTYRAINIALVNELKVLYDKMGIDVWEVIEAAKTKPFGFQAFYPGPGLGGHCLADCEWVTIRDIQGVHTVRIGDLFDRCLREEGRTHRRAGSVEELQPRGIEALAVHPKSGNAAFAKVTHVFRRDCATPRLKVHIRGNRQLTVTDGHPMLVVGYEGIEERRADDLKPGDEVVLLASWPTDNGSVADIDLVEMAVRRGLPAIRVMPRHGTWRDHDQIVRPACVGRRVSAKDVYRHNTLPLSVYVDLESTGKSPFARNAVTLVTGKGNGWNRVPATIQIDEDFARLVGYYLSEGCITEDKGLRVRICFGSHETELIQDTQAILTRLGFQHSVHRLKTCLTTQIKVSSRLLATLLRDEFGCGVRSEDAQAPSILMGGPRSIRRALLAGLLRGDGDVSLASGRRPYRKNGRAYSHEFNAATVGYFSSSPVLFQQAMLLLQGEGLIPTCHRSKPHLRVCGRQAEILEPLFVGMKQERLAAYRANRSKSMLPRSWQEHGPFATAKVVAVERVEPGPVYSMEIEGYQTFVTSFGIAVHNCIPIDPFYLTWVARQYGFATRFIELAGEVNTSMPSYVVSRVADALNDRGKPVKGSKVAILGMAYKKDVDDPRESPGFELMNLLIQKGAQVSYNDPHIPSLPVMRHYPNLRMTSQELTDEYLSAQDCVLIATDHSVYGYPWIVQHASLVIDTRNATRAVTSGREKIVKA
jgi:UDP-N-acetyl-D-mannosaminuronate dehydrogenase/intein/homing endonuclease